MELLAIGVVIICPDDWKDLTTIYREHVCQQLLTKIRQTPKVFLSQIDIGDLGSHVIAAFFFFLVAGIMQAGTILNSIGVSCFMACVCF